MAKKKKRERMSAFTIIILLIFLLAAVTLILPEATFDAAGNIVNGSGVVSAKLPDVLLSPILGFEDAVDVGPITTQLFREPRYRTVLSLELLFDDATDMNHK